MAKNERKEQKSRPKLHCKSTPIRYWLVLEEKIPAIFSTQCQRAEKQRKNKLRREKQGESKGTYRERKEVK